MRQLTGRLIGLGTVVLALVVSSAHAGYTIQPDVVTVGNAGNAADSTGFGTVDYVYGIGKYEVTAGQYTAFLNAAAGVDPYGLYDTWMGSSDRGCGIQRAGSSGSYTYSVAADRANRPVNGVSWYDAVRFCNWLTTGDTETGVYTFNVAGTVTDILDHQTAAETLGGTAWFLPTEDEWYKAAYHMNDGVTGNYSDYPTGTDTSPSHDLITPDPGNNANFEPSPGDYTIGSPYYMTEVGEFENSQSPYGTFDQGGNLWEWNETLIGSSRGLRGGAWSSDASSLAASYRSSSIPTNYHDSIGFRVASSQAVPAPSSAVCVSSLLAMGLVASWWRRRRKR